MDSPSASPSETLTEQYQALLEVSESIAAHHDLAKLFRDLAQRLPRVIKFSSLVLALHDPDRNVMRLHILEDPRPGPVSPGLEFPVEEVPGGWVWQHQQPLVCMHVEQETRFPKVMPMIRAAGIRSLCIVPLTTARRRLGALGVGSLEETDYGRTGLDFLEQVAKQVAVAVDNALNFASAEASQKALERERDRLSLMLKINNAVVSHLELRELMKVISACLRRVIPNDLAGLALYDAGTRQLVAQVLDFPHNQDFVEMGHPIPLEGTPEGRAFTSRETVLIKELNLTEFPAEIVKRGAAEGLKSGCAVPLISHGRVLGTLSVVSLHEGAFTEDDAELLSHIGAQVAIAVENGLAYREIEDLKRQTEQGKAVPRRRNSD